MFGRGLLIVISGPSGAGKSTLLDLVKEQNKNAKFSVSVTTRNPREGEVNGLDYFFKSVEEFKQMIDHRELVEWVEYCGNYYGTPREYVSSTLREGYDVILEIETDGAQNIKNSYPGCVSIFIIPPSFGELKKRIEGRGTEEAEVIEKRMNRAKKEIMYIDKYDYIVINDNVERAARDIGSIIRAEKLSFKRNSEVLESLDLT